MYSVELYQQGNWCNEYRWIKPLVTVHNMDFFLWCTTCEHKLHDPMNYICVLNLV